MHYREIDFSEVLPHSLPVKLSLIFNEAQAGFSQLQYTHHSIETALASEGIDAWFLDGFSPSKNPSMWQDSLFEIMAKLSFYQNEQSYTTLATFTAAGFVRRGLKQSGFNMAKRKGFGRKRDMLIGQFQGKPQALHQLKNSTKKQAFGDFWPIYTPQKNLYSKQQSVAIIGAGISGLSTALSLAKAGFKVSVYESNDDAMQEASGNPQAVLFPKLSPHKTPLSEFNLLSLNFAVGHYQQLNQYANLFTQCGLLQCEANETKEQLQELADCFPQLMRFVDAKEASTISQTSIQTHALYYAGLGFVDTQALKTTLLNQQGIQLITDCHVEKISQHESKMWCITDHQKNNYDADFLVICNANAAHTLLPKHSIQLKNIRGQITQAHQHKNSDINLPNITTTICHKGYINPSVEKNGVSTYSFGASFDLKNNNKKADEASDNYNIEQLKKYLPDFSALQNPAINQQGIAWQARVNFRCTTNDYMPVVGPVVNEAETSDDFAMYRKNAHAHIPKNISCHEGLFINVAYGSRGFTTAPISAEVITAYLTAGIQPLPKSLIKAIHPGRFFIKQCKQGKI